jgi:GTP cyclohydrolase I
MRQREESDFIPNPRTAEESVRYLLRYIGEDPTREGLLDTPKRVAKALSEMTSGTFQDAGEVLGTVFEDPCDQLIVVRGIRFASLCEHHLLPFTGVAAVGYIPNGKVVGLSKIPRLVEMFAKRCQMQERLTAQVATSLMDVLHPLGVGVVCKAHHACMGCRGVRQPDAEMITSHLLGVAREDPSVKAELMSLL